jgi:hypothetical protein
MVEKGKVIEFVNEDLKKNNRPIMNEKELKKILNDLEKMKCIKDAGDRWCLVDELEVSVSYED